VVTVIRRRQGILEGIRPPIAVPAARPLTRQEQWPTLYDMSYEVEVKYRLADLDQLQRRLAERGTAAQPAIVQEDTYFSHPSRDFALTNEALRLRRIMEENRITYKGPRRSGPTKTREEIEIGVAPGDEARRDLLRLFEKLGFHPVATIRKTRTPFHLTAERHDIEVALDEAEGLGDFAEIETLAATESDLPAAQAAILAVADQLGLTEVEPRSYLRMALDARRQAKTSLLPAKGSLATGANPPRESPTQTG
jgi:adenylate cyclase, class 2